MKTYIGNAKQRPGSEYVVITLDINAVLNAESFEVGGKTYVKCILAKRVRTDDYGNTHTVYVPEPERGSYNDRLIDEQERQE